MNWFVCVRVLLSFPKKSGRRITVHQETYGGARDPAASFVARRLRPHHFAPQEPRRRPLRRRPRDHRLRPRLLLFFPFGPLLLTPRSIRRRRGGEINRINLSITSSFRRKMPFSADLLFSQPLQSNYILSYTSCLCHLIKKTRKFKASHGAAIVVLRSFLEIVIPFFRVSRWFNATAYMESFLTSSQIYQFG